MVETMVDTTGPELRGTSRDECIRAYQTCHEACLSTLAYIIDRPALETHSTLIQSILDCADLCHASADFLARGSDLAPKLCELTTDACEAAAAACSEVTDDRRIQALAQRCRAAMDICSLLLRSGLHENLEVAEEAG